MSKKMEAIEPERKKSEVILVMVLGFSAAMIANIGNILQGSWISSAFVIGLMASSIYFYLDRRPTGS